MKTVVRRIILWGMTLAILVGCCGGTFAVNDPDGKIDEKLFVAMERGEPGKVYEIWIFRELMDRDLLNQRLLERGFDPEIYNNNFNTVIRPPIEAAIWDEISANADDMTEEELLRAYRRAVTLAVTEAADAYVQARREVVREYYEASNEAFLSEHVPGNRKILYAGSYTGTFIMEATAEEIEHYAILGEVQQVALYENKQWTNWMYTEPQEINDPDCKIDDKLYAALERGSGDSVYKVWIFRNLIDHSLIDQQLLELGYNPVDYEKNFDTVIRPAVEAAVWEEISTNAGDMTKEELIQAYRRAVTLALSDTANAYLQIRRQLVKQAYEASNEAFLSEHVPGNRKIAYAGSYTGTFILEANQEEIEHYVSLGEVQRVSLYENKQWSNWGELDWEQVEQMDPQDPVWATYEAPEFEFHDVAPNAYYHDPVRWATNTEPPVTLGTSRDNFSPNEACTRAQIVTFLWRAAGSPEPTGGNPFLDVRDSTYYSKAVQWAFEAGITAGTGAMIFNPDKECTRAEIVTFLWRASDSPAVTGEKRFDDVRAGAYYERAVQWAVENGITAGTSAGMFSPDAICTRAQAMTFLYRFFEA